MGPGKLTGMAHQIAGVWADEDDAVWWRCADCGEVDAGYASVAEARYAAAEHQLPVAAQEMLPCPQDSVEEWREAVTLEVAQAAEAQPVAWRWWHDTAR